VTHLVSHGRRNPRRRWYLLVAVLGLAGLVGVGVAVLRPRPTSGAPGGHPAGAARGDLIFHRLADPDRTEVDGPDGRRIAVFTDGARTVALEGPQRTFAEPAYTTATVTTTTWVRLAPHEWRDSDRDAGWLRPWLATAAQDTSPDAFAVAMQYIHDAPPLTDSTGLRYAGDASFGPVDPRDPDGRAEANDFYDYLGIDWTFPDAGLVHPKRSRLGDIDCSGFLRMVYGYRLGYPLRDLNTPGEGLPRRAYAMSRYGPGVEVITERGAPVPADEYARLQPGDLLFFDTDPSTVGQNDHSGIYLGRDDAGHYRFISSRAKADGPTLGDYGGPAILDGGGHFSRLLRNSRRL